MSKHRKTRREAKRAVKATTQEAEAKQAGKKEIKPKTVAAEVNDTARREERIDTVPASGETVQSPEPAPKRSAKPVPPTKIQPPKHETGATKAAIAALKAEPTPARSSSAIRAAENASATQHLLGKTVDTIEQSLKAAGRGTLAVNCKLIDFARTNINSGLDHAKDLAGARSPARILRLQFEYWQDCLATFADQARELRALSAELVANTNEPLRRAFFDGPPRAA